MMEQFQLSPLMAVGVRPRGSTSVRMRRPPAVATVPTLLTVMV